MVSYNLTALRAHQYFCVFLTGVDGSLDASLCRIIKAHSTSLEDVVDEALNLVTQRFIGRRLMHQTRKLPVCTLEAHQKFITDKDRGNQFSRNVWSPIRGGHGLKSMTYVI